MGGLQAIFQVTLLAIFALFPFFEGGETSTGLFIFHSITLIGLFAAALTFSVLWIPRFLGFFIPFALVVVISTLFSEYKYAAFLRASDYVMGAAWAILLCTFVREKKGWVDSLWVWIFTTGALSTIIALLIYNPGRFARMSASFVNANEYATFAFLLLCLGLFCLERETDRNRKILIGVLSTLLLISIALTLSRGIFIACLVVATVVFFRRRAAKTIKILLVLLILVSGLFTVLRFQSYDDPFKYYRWKIWKSSLQGLSEDAYLGVGLGMLEYRSRTFNFPAETELARYGRIARSADSQYVEILAEMGFLGLLTFLFAWGGLFFSLRRSGEQYFYLRQAWLILTIVASVSIPLQNTTVLFLFLFLVVVSVADSDTENIRLSLYRPTRILAPVLCFLIFVFGVYLPYRSHKEFQRAAESRTLTEANEHLLNATRYNPYQPYYRFFFIRRIVDSRPSWETSRWLNLISHLDEAIQLNPLEFDFYLYKGRIYRILLEKEPKLAYYSAAISAYQNSLDLNPFNVFLRLEFASFLTRLQRYELAESELVKILEAEPAYLNARLFLADVLIARQRHQEAETEYQKFQSYHERFRQNANYSQSQYVRSLLQVNRKQKMRVEALLKTG